MITFRCPECQGVMITRRSGEPPWCPNKCLEKAIAAEKKARDELLLARRKL